MARKTKKINVQEIVQQITSTRSKVNIHKALVPTPSTTLNLACSDTPDGAFIMGGMINIIGDSSSGKTFLCLGVLAEACAVPVFDEYRLIFDDVENANSFDLSHLFGERLNSRIEPPRTDKDGLSLPSETVEDFHFNVLRALENPKPCIYVLDSFDALDADQDREKVEEQREAKERGVKPKGSYGMSKPKKASELLRNICGRLSKSNSLLIIISQTRDDINPMTFTKKTRSGGKALKFYALHEIWLAMAGKIPSKKLIIGNKVKAKVSKNKLTGKEREVGFQIYYDIGVDDLRSCIDFLVQENVFKKSGNTIKAPQLNKNGTTATLIKHIESKNLEGKLIQLVEKTWLSIESGLKLGRKRKYK